MHRSDCEPRSFVRYSSGTLRKRNFHCSFQSWSVIVYKKKVHGYIRIYHLETENVEWLLFRETGEKGWRLTGGPTTPSTCTDKHTCVNPRWDSRKLGRTRENWKQRNYIISCHFQRFLRHFHISVFRERVIDSMILLKNFVFFFIYITIRDHTSFFIIIRPGHTGSPPKRIKVS